MERKYKNSGIPWMMQIPSEWKVIRGKNLLNLINRPVREDDDVVTCFRDGEVILRSERRTEGFTMSDKEIGYQGINKGDIVIHGMDGFAGSMGVSKSTGKGSPVLIVCNPKSDDDARFIIYYLRTLAMNNVFVALATGIRERSCDLRWNKISVLPFVRPSFSEQHKIADFIDKKSKEIDSLIGLQEQMIEKLKAYKQSIITEAVTKGLDLNAKLVHSGIDWIGEVPKGWKVCRIKDISSINSNSLNENTQSDFEFDYVDIGSVSFEQGIYKSEHYLFKDAPSRARKKANLGDIVMSTVRTYLRAIDVIDTVEKSQYIYSTGFAIITPKTNVLSSFLSYITKSDCFLKQVIVYSKGINYPSINTNELMAISVALPPISEQTIIAEYLSKKCKEIDVLVSIKQQKIEKLKDYKKSIIYEAVTGKIIIES